MSARLWLFVIWFVGFAASFSVVLSFPVVGYTITEAVGANLTQVTGIFAPYLGPIVAYWFVEDVIGARRPYDTTAFRVAIVCSVFYNIVLFLIIASIFVQEDGVNVIERSLDLAAQVATALAFIVGPAIGYFFGKSPGTQGNAGENPASFEAKG